MPAVIVLGLAISSVGIVAMQVVATNSSQLNEQYLKQLAKEAAQSGIIAAKYCMQTSEILASWTTPLTPQKNCSLATAYANDYVADTTSASSSSGALPFTSTYSVPVPVPGDGDTANRTWVVSSTGMVKVKTPGGTTIKTVSKTLRAYMVASTQYGTKLISTLSTGPSTACAIAKDPIKSRDWAYCWGDNSDSQLGSGGNYVSNRSTVPVAVNSSPTDVQVSTPANPCNQSFKPSCATAFASAINMDGRKVTDISVGVDHACMVATDLSGGNGRAYCWGRNDYGQLGRGGTNTTDSKIPVAVDTTGGSMTTLNVTAISAGDGFTCAIADSQTYCWGRNDYGQAGMSSASKVYSPARIAMNNPTRTLARVYGGATMCAISTNDASYCWGQSFAGQRGDGYMGTDQSDSDVSACRQGGGAVANVDPIPLDTSRDKSDPSLVSGGLKFSSITITGKDSPGATDQGTFTNYVTAQASDTGRIYYWGGTTYYQKRTWTTGCAGTDNKHVEHATVDRTYSGSAAPTGPLYNSTTAGDLNGKSLGLASGNAVGGYFCTQPAATSNPLYCDVHGGPANDGQFGNGANYSGCPFRCPPSSPQAVTMSPFGSFSSFNAMDTGDNYTCVVADKKVYCWGRGDKGQIGNGSASDQSTPTSVAIDDISSALFVDPTQTTISAPVIKAIF